MKKTYIRILLTALLPLGACSDDLKTGAGEGDTSLPIILKAAYPTATRASDAGFEDGDRMGLYVLDHTAGTAQAIDGAPHASNVRFEFDETTNTCRGVTDIYWTDKQTPADFVAYYPFTDDIADPRELPLAVERRQDTEGEDGNPGGYEASDFLYVRLPKVMPTGETVNLTFGHALAGIRVSLVAGDGFGADEWSGMEKSVGIMNTVAAGSIDLADGTVTPGSGTPTTIIPLQHDGDYRAVVIPQSVAAGKSLVALTVGGIGYELVKSEDMIYQAGKMHSFTITVSKKGEGGLSFALTTEGITDWFDSVEFRDGLMRQYIVVDVPEAGTLGTIMTERGLDTRRVYNLKLKGKLNHDDFAYIRENVTNLKAINLLETSVESFVDHGSGVSGIEKDLLPAAGLRGMETLSHIVFPGYVREIGNEFLRGTGIMGDVVIPEGVEVIGWAAFMDCKSILGVGFPSTLREIGGAAFQRTSISGELVLPDGLESIGGSAFQGTRLSGELHFPSSLKAIGEEAFRDCAFTGSLVFPQGIKEVPARCFSGFSGTLTLPEGVEKICAEAFERCGFRGELKLPESLKSIEHHAFRENQISSIVFPRNLGVMGEGVFMNCSRLSGTLEIPKNMSDIPRDAFRGCSLLDGIVIPAGVNRINGGAFAECYNLSSIVCHAEEPPLLKQTYVEDNLNRPMLVFQGVPRDNFTVEVPAKSVGAYQEAIEWSEFKRIAAYSGFVCRPASACALNNMHREEIVLNADGAWTVTHCPDWITLSQTSGTGKTSLNLTFQELAKGNGERTDYVEFSLAGEEAFTTRCEVAQKDYEYEEDGCLTLQTHTAGNGIEIVFVGDGFDAEAIASGDYLKQVRAQMEYFFGVEPYKTYRGYFNVKVCFPLSQETGVNTANNWRNTKFGTYYAPPSTCTSGLLECHDPDAVFRYVEEKAGIDAGKMWQTLVVMTLNSDEYGSNSIIAESGASIAVVGRSADPYPMDSRGLMQREAGGVAFGKLADERMTRVMYLSKSERETIAKNQARGWYMNLSLSGGLGQVWWAKFILDARYSEKVDVYEGGFGKTRGCFRSEINSCMNFGIPYFSFAARYDIVRRIMEYSGQTFTEESFLEKDSDEWGATDATRAQGDMASPRISYRNQTKYYKSRKY